MKHKRRLSVYDIARLESVPVALPQGDAAPVGTLAQYRRRLQEDEAQAAAKKQAEIERVQTDTSRLMAECLSVSAPQMTKFWGQPLLRKIKARLHDDSVFDNLFLPTSEETVDSNKIYDTIQTFLDDEVFKQGYSLGDISRRRFGLYVASQVNAGVIVNNPALAVMFKRCFELGIFKDNSGTEFNNNLRAETPVKQPRVQKEIELPRRATMDDLLALGDSQQDQRDARRIADELYFDERQPMVRAWFESLANNFGIVITHADADYCKKWFQRNNKSFLVAAHFNECRRHMVASHRWPVSCLTNLEAFELSLETIETSQLTVGQRNDLRRREQAAREADIARFGHV
jgi:hypothetical protein